jgi:hypothetical protein
MPRMQRDEPAHPGGPTAADVHPDEVAAWAAAGWRLAEDTPAAVTRTTPNKPQRSDQQAARKAKPAQGCAPE